jgi:hypothetical protein
LVWIKLVERRKHKYYGKYQKLNHKISNEWWSAYLLT